MTLLFLLLFHPYVEDRDIFLKGLFMMVLLSGIYAASKQTRPLVLTCLIGIPTLVAHAVSIVLIQPDVEMAVRVGNVLFTALTTIVIFILLEPEVTSDVLSGAVCVYLLSGLTWASLYILIETIQLGSFHVSHSRNSSGTMTYSLMFKGLRGYGRLGYVSPNVYENLTVRGLKKCPFRLDHYTLQLRLNSIEHLRSRN
jgi:hypothetical protein